MLFTELLYGAPHPDRYIIPHLTRWTTPRTTIRAHEPSRGRRAADSNKFLSSQHEELAQHVTRHTTSNTFVRTARSTFPSCASPTTNMFSLVSLIIILFCILNSIFSSFFVVYGNYSSGKTFSIKVYRECVYGFFLVV